MFAMTCVGCLSCMFTELKLARSAWEKFVSLVAIISTLSLSSYIWRILIVLSPGHQGQDYNTLLHYAYYMAAYCLRLCEKFNQIKKIKFIVKFNFHCPMIRRGWMVHG